MGLSLNEYQEKAMTTCMESSNNFSYMFLNLVGEVGEFASKIAKGIRKKKMQIGGFENKGAFVKNELYFSEFPTCIEQEEELMKEAGDILWQLSGLCTVMGWSLEDVAQHNLDKLAARKAVGTIDGSGDGIIRRK